DSGNLLDGDVIDALALDSLPSGDGVEGGDAVIKFTIICAFGDADCDSNVDLHDFAAFQSCFTGADNGPAVAGCEMMLFDTDRDVDLDDFAAFENALLGP
ncbi:MAG: hypothetical protein GY842_02550, partial [bacterium]|nr:hypothetical protein [bacterium]